MLLMRLTEHNKEKVGIVANGKLNPRRRAGAEVTDGLWEASQWPPGEWTQRAGRCPGSGRVPAQGRGFRLPDLTEFLAAFG